MVKQESWEKEAKNSLAEFKLKHGKDVEIPKFQQFKRVQRREQEQNKWLTEVMLASKGGDLWFSGGARILLWEAYIHGGWEKLIKEIRKRKNKGQLAEVLEFRYREKIIGVDLLKKLSKSKLAGMLDDN